MSRPDDMFDEQTMLTAIKGSGGIVSTIAKRLDCSWRAARNYADKFESTRQAMKDEKQTILDMAEGTLYKSIQEGDVQSAKWILSTLGKDRGYSEKQEIEHTISSGRKKLVDLLESEDVERLHEHLKDE